MHLSLSLSLSENQKLNSGILPYFCLIYIDFEVLAVKCNWEIGFAAYSLGSDNILVFLY